MPTKAEWAAARFKYETDPSVTQTEIGETLGCSQQAVAKRCKSESWIKAVVPDSVEKLDIVKPVAGSRLGLRCPENIAELVNVYALTGNKGTAARVIGIDDQTLANWIKEDPELSVVMASSRDRFLLAQSGSCSMSYQSQQPPWHRRQSSRIFFDSGLDRTSEICLDHLIRACRALRWGNRGWPWIRHSWRPPLKQRGVKS